MKEVKIEDAAEENSDSCFAASLLKIYGINVVNYLGRRSLYRQKPLPLEICFLIEEFVLTSSLKIRTRQDYLTSRKGREISISKMTRGRLSLFPVVVRYYKNISFDRVYYHKVEETFYKNFLFYDVETIFFLESLIGRGWWRERQDLILTKSRDQKFRKEFQWDVIIFEKSHIKNLVCEVEHEVISASGDLDENYVQDFFRWRIIKYSANNTENGSKENHVFFADKVICKFSNFFEELNSRLELVWKQWEEWKNEETLLRLEKERDKKHQLKEIETQTEEQEGESDRLEIQILKKQLTLLQQQREQQLSQKEEEIKQQFKQEQERIRQKQEKQEQEKQEQEKQEQEKQEQEKQNSELTNKLLRNEETIQRLNQTIIDRQRVANQKYQQLEGQLSTTQNKLQEVQEKNVCLENKLQKQERKIKETEREVRSKSFQRENEQEEQSIETFNNQEKLVSGDSITKLPSPLKIFAGIFLTIIASGFLIWVIILIYEKVKTWFKELKKLKNDKKEN